MKRKTKPHTRQELAAAKAECEGAWRALWPGESYAPGMLAELAERVRRERDEARQEIAALKARAEKAEAEANSNSLPTITDLLNVYARSHGFPEAEPNCKSIKHGLDNFNDRLVTIQIERDEAREEFRDLLGRWGD